jgi:RNA polymerase sigma-70 factor (ECF subfamily)
MTPSEFDNIVLRLKDKLYRFVIQILKDTDDAQDIIQETFLKLWSSKEELKKIRNIEAYSMTMARNLSLDHIKSGKMRKLKLRDFDTPLSGRREESRMEHKDAMEKVKQIIESLPETQRLVMHLRDVEEMEYDEIGAIMSLNANAVRVNLSRARKHVRDELVKKYHYEYR